MAIPNIEPYPMPTVSELPTNNVSWTVETNRVALLIHDMQHYFLKSFSPDQPPITTLYANIQALKEHAVQLGIPVIYSAQPANQTAEQRGLLCDFWGKGISEKPIQQEIVHAISPSDSDIVMTKWRYSAFQKTELQQILQKHRRDQLIICGIYAHIGCLLTACEAFMKDIQTFFIVDAMADFSLKHHQMAITYAAERCAMTMTTEQLLEQLSQGRQKMNEQNGATMTLTKERVRDQISQLLNISPEEIDDDEDLLQLGLDSIRMMHLVESWRSEGVELTFAQLAEKPALRHWWKLLSLPVDIVPPNEDY